jgi:hypothetical protein
MLPGMKRVEKWLWRIRWGGRMTTTRAHFTEEEIRREHPDAQRVTISRIVVELPDTPAERDAAMSQRGRR